MRSEKENITHGRGSRSHNNSNSRGISGIFSGRWGRNVQQQISTRTLGISLTDAQSGELPEDSILLKGAMPGEEINLENKLVVTNTGDTPLYTRVTVSKCWGSYENASFKKEFDKDSEAIKLVPNSDWYIMENTEENDENLYLYYRAPLEVSGQTSSILEGLEIAKTLTNEYADKGIQLNVEVDAVQASESEAARQDAILAEWGVWAEFDGHWKHSRDRRIMDVVQEVEKK